MHRRTLILFSLFVVAAITAVLFAFFYRQATNRMINGYVAQITTCGNIVSEEDCYARDFCEGIYGPSCANCQDQAFRRCEKVPPAVEAELTTARALCQNTGGQWYHNRLGSSCLCQAAGANMTFDRERGCVAQAATPQE